MIRIGVTGTGSLIGQAIIKCIKRSAYFGNSFLVGFDYVDETVGSYWVDKNYKLPDILKTSVKSEEIIEEVITVIRQEQIRLLFVGIDFDLPLYAKYKMYIQSKTECIVFVSDPKVVDIADNKYKTYQFLFENNLYCPQTFLYKDFTDQLTYPVVLKPAIGAGSKDVSIIDSKEMLDAKAKGVENPIIQELIGDEESEYTCGVLMLDNKIVDKIVLKRKLHKGNTSKAIFRKDFPPIIYHYLSDVTNILKPYGVCNYQLRIDKRGIPKIFEINSRHSGTTYFRTLFGYNEIDLILNHYFPIKDFKKKELKEGTAIRYFEEIFIDSK